MCRQFDSAPATSIKARPPQVSRLAEPFAFRLRYFAAAAPGPCVLRCNIAIVVPDLWFEPKSRTQYSSDLQRWGRFLLCFMGHRRDTAKKNVLDHHTDATPLCSKARSGEWAHRSDNVAARSTRPQAVCMPKPNAAVGDISQGGARPVSQGDVILCALHRRPSRAAQSLWFSRLQR